MPFVRVALAVPLMRLFDYQLPAEMATPAIGARVVVPFGNQKKIGIVIDHPEQTDIADDQLKSLLHILDQENLFTTELWHLLHWAATYYQTPLGEVLFNALPIKLRQGESAVEKSETFWKLTALGHQLLQNGELTRAKKQLEALQTLSKTPLLKSSNDFSSAVWSQLKQKNAITEFERVPNTPSWQQKLNEQPLCYNVNKLTLNTQQTLVMSKLVFHQGFGVFLLEGVTGSGKTEIYLQQIEEILKKNQQVLVLVPEIGLTPQTVRRFRARFNVEIDILHSNINDNQRLKTWQRAKKGQTAIVIGTRSALFTPFANLGLIIIDEEHDASFKQQEGWRYHARDLAVFYAKLLNISIVLGSATPSLESLNNVKKGKYQHLSLTLRASNVAQIKQHLIDLKQQRIHQGLSDRLLAQIEQHLNQGNQVMLFLNRRGFAPVLLCHECGWIAQCTQCEKPYTYHQHQRILKCHHCHSQHRLPYQCPECGSTHLITTGEGTEQLELALKQRFPTYGITRIDRDNTARKGKLESHLADIQQGKSQILIGTQMLSKGHHFPNVTLVAIINVDSSLFSLDFRAEERLAQLYIQVAGRAGRAEKQGEVVLQTHYPDHPLLQTLIKEGYSAFAEQALQMRQSLSLPPYSAQALFKAKSRLSEETESELQKIAEFFTALSVPHLHIVGPIPATHSKKAGQFHWQLLLQHPSKSALQQCLNQYRQQQTTNHKVRLILDVDPLDFS